MNLVKKKKTQNMNANLFCIIIFLEEKDKAHEYACEKHRNLSKKKKKKSINMLVNDIELFLKGFNFSVGVQKLIFVLKIQIFWATVRQFFKS